MNTPRSPTPDSLVPPNKAVHLEVRQASLRAARRPARYVVSDRLCGAPAGKPGAAELRLLAGKASALVLVRVVDGP